MKRSTLLLILFCVVCENAKLPPNFQKCNRSEPDWRECVLKAAQNGVSQLTHSYDEVNIPNVNPYLLPALTVSQGSGVVAVDQNFKNCEFFGIHEIKLDKFEFDFDKKTLHISGSFPEIVKKCEYELDGKVLLLPIKGTGPSTILLKNLAADVVFDFEELKRRGKTYIKILSTDLKVNPERVVFNFENLFNGDKKLGDNINQVLNENWKEVFDEVKNGYIEAINKILTSLFTNFFAKVSIEEAFD